MVIAVLAAVAVAYLGFQRGDARRRGAAGQQGPRAAPSIGEAVRLAKAQNGLALIIFLGDDPASIEGLRSLAEDEGTMQALATTGIYHSTIRSGRVGADIAAALFKKYTQETWSEGPAALLLNGEGERLALGLAAEHGPLGSWLTEWTRQAIAAVPPRKASPRAKPVAQDGD
jgi:hypothetical protein